MARSDEQIKKEIVDALYWDQRIDASNIEVSVDAGVVTLNGAVPTYGELSAVRANVWSIEGVVNCVDNVAVNYLTPPALPSDAEIMERAENIIAWEPMIDESEITVTAVDGIVSLEGNVNAYWKKAFVENRISGIRGITRIENKLTVVPSEKINDELIAEDVMAALERNLLVDAKNVTVEVANSVVTLSGDVPNRASQDAAVQDAARTAGVIDVNNMMRMAA